MDYKRKEFMTIFKKWMFWKLVERHHKVFTPKGTSFFKAKKSNNNTNELNESQLLLEGA